MHVNVLLVHKKRKREIQTFLGSEFVSGLKEIVKFPGRQPIQKGLLINKTCMEGIK